MMIFETMTTANSFMIELAKYRAQGAHVFTGRDRGAQVRKLSGLDDEELKYEKVVVVIPREIYSINPSFFEELFVNVVKRYGREGFLKRFEFKAEGEYPYERPLNEAISRIMRRGSVLG